MMISVLVVEDHHLVRQGICKLLEDDPNIQVVGEADNGEAAIQLVEQQKPNVLLLDISLPKLNGLEVLKKMNLPDGPTKVVILSMHGDMAIVQQALKDGALGYVLKQSVSEELLDAVRAAARGSLYLSAGVAAIFSNHLLNQRAHNPLDRLSPREKEVVAHIIDGKSMKQIAETLQSSIKTIEKQRLDAMRKLGVDNIASLVRLCLELDLRGIAKTEPPLDWPG
jgi:DNA-binding NarL/FixJ family response regulator